MSAALIAVALVASSAAAQVAGLPQSAPHGGYFVCFAPYYDGDFRNAGAAFRDAAQGRIITTAQTPWIDSICYHTMMGECSYQMGNLPDALDQYSTALKIFLANRYWLLRIDFDSQPLMPEENSKEVITWGATKRRTTIGHFPDHYSSLRGRLDNQNVLRTGGIIDPPELHPVYVTEIIRCTALALSRRRALMGPVCEHDPLTEQLVAALALRPGPPNHWSQCWVELELGLAYAEANKVPEAVQELTKSLLAVDRYDHPLTCVGLLELGRLAYEQGKYDAAITYLHEATISAAFFDRYDVMEEAFRLGAEAHLVSGQKGVYPPLVPATLALAKKSRPLSVSLLTSLAEQFCTAGELTRATATITEAHTAQGRHELAKGAIGSRLSFQSARVALHAGDSKTGSAALTAALAYQKVGSRRLFQIGLTDGLYKSGGVTERIADSLFAEVLREPTPNDWVLDPFETLAAGLTPHPLPYEHWFEVALARRDQEKALNIADRIRRHRFYITQPLGGRLLALRWILEGPPETLTPEAALQRQNLLLKFPKFGELSRRSAEIRGQLQALPVVPTADPQLKQRGELLAELTKVCGLQEAMLQAIALDRVGSELTFPPLRETKEIQKELPDGTLVFSYLATSRNVYAFAVAKDRYGSFTVAQPAKVRADVTEMLKHLGLNDRNFPVTADELKANGWRPAAERLLKELTNNTPPSDWAKYRELVIVPDSVLWYLPFEALPVPVESKTSPLVMQIPLRYAPTLSLAVPDRRGNRPVARTVIVGGKLLPRDDDAFAKSGWEAVAGALPGSTLLTGSANLHAEPLPASSAIFSSTFDRLVVLKDAEDSDKLPFGWSPLAIDAARPGGTLADWTQLPFGVDQVVLPGFHTSAESALKRGGTGDELFLATCGLMASGCRTILLSRWRVGGQSTIDLMREFVQELPHESAAAAWQRSVRLASSRPIDAATEGRVKTTPAKPDVSAEHPFFWSGYLLVDTGRTPTESAEKQP